MLDNFLNTYQKLDKDNLSLLQEIYASDVVFIDPAHEIRGITALSAYFDKLYSNINHIQFDYTDTFTDATTASIYWRMTFSHPAISKGKDIVVMGNSLVKFRDDGKAYYHRDIFDLGSMLYEHLPILGSIVRYAKKQLAAS